MSDGGVTSVLRREGRRIDPEVVPELERQRTFGDYLSDLYPYRLYIAGFALLLGAFGFLSTVGQPKQYQATAKMLVKTKSDLDPSSRATEITNVIAVLQGETLQRAVHKQLSLDQPPTNVPFASFQASVVVRQVIGSNVVLVQVVLPDAAKAAQSANLICERGTNESRLLNQQEAVSTRDTLTAQADTAIQRLQETENALNEFRRKSQLEVLQSDVDSALWQRSHVRDLQIERAGKEAKLAAAEAELQRHPRLNTLTRSVDRDQAMSQAASQTAPDARLLGLSMKEEEINAVARELEDTIATLRADIAGVKREERELLNKLKVQGVTLPEVAELHTRELQQARLKGEYDIAKKVYEETKLRSQQAGLDIANRSSTFQMFDPALPPALPIGPHPVRSAALAFLVGLVIATLAATAIASVRNAQRGVRTA